VAKPVAKPAKAAAKAKPVEKPVKAAATAKPAEKPVKAAAKANPVEKPAKAVAKAKPAEKPVKATAKAKPVEKPAKAKAAKAEPKPAAPPEPVAPPAPLAKAARGKPAASPRPLREAGTARDKVAPALLDRLVIAACRSLEDDKAENILVLDVTGRADYADRLVIATGLVDRQIQAMATHLGDAFETEGLKLRRDATQASPDWVLIDAGDLVIHLFKPEARAMYALERMWGPDSPRASALPGPLDVLPDDGSVPEAGLEDEELDDA